APCWSLWPRASGGVFFFQAEDGIRDRNVTGVQTCALPIYVLAVFHGGPRHQLWGDAGGVLLPVALVDHLDRLGAGLGDVSGQVLPVGDRRPVPGDDTVAGFQAGGRGGAGLILWAAVGLSGRGGHTWGDAGQLVAGD